MRLPQCTTVKCANISQTDKATPFKFGTHIRRGQFLPPDHKLAPKWAWPGVRDPNSKLAGAGAYCGGHLAAQLVIIIITAMCPNTCIIGDALYTSSLTFFTLSGISTLLLINSYHISTATRTPTLLARTVGTATFVSFDVSRIDCKSQRGILCNRLSYTGNHALRRHDLQLRNDMKTS